MSTYDDFMVSADPAPRQIREHAWQTPMRNVGAVIVFCAEHGLDPAEVRLGNGYLSWLRLETEQEVAQRVERAHTSASRHVMRVGEMYAEYVQRGLLPSPQPPQT